MMQSSRPILHTLSAAAVSSVLLAACGGGDPAADVAAATAADAAAKVTPSIVISPRNAPALVAETLQLVGIQNLGRFVTLRDTGNEDAAERRKSRSATALLRHAGKQGTTPAAESAADNGLVLVETRDCAGGGTVTETLTFADAFATTAGDSEQDVFHGCVEGPVTTDGSLTNILRQFSPDDLSFLVHDIVARDLRFTSGGETQRMDGTLRNAFQSTDTQLVLSIGSAKTASFSTARRAGGVTRASVVVSGLNFVQREPQGTGEAFQDITLSASGYFSSLGSAATFSVATLETLRLPALRPDAVSGRFVITGRQSHLRATLTDGGVKIEVVEPSGAKSELFRTRAQLAALLNG